MRTWPDSADREAKWSRGSCVLIWLDIH
jgi:hypothetical protein